MDYHKSMRNYLNAKLILLKKLLKKNSFIIADKSIPQFKKIKNIAEKKLKKKINKLLEKDYNLESFKLIGNFQKKNLMMAIKACEILGLSKKNISNV